jgi:uncharacterized membrane protein HdeD (DUF308 family)
MRDTVTPARGRAEKWTHDMEGEVRKHKGWYLFEGAVFLIAGILAIALPGMTTAAVAMIAGAALTVTGAIRLVNAFRFNVAKGWRFISGLILAAGGGAMLWSPLLGVATLVLITGVLLLAEGIIEVFLSLIYRPLFHWGLLLFSGITSLVLGGFILGIPVTGVIFIAIVVGLSMIFYGVALLALVMKAAKET